MDFYEQSSGRVMEAIVGVILFFIAFVFSFLVYMTVSNATLGYASILGSITLGLCSFCFGKLGYRLVFYKPRRGGGLFSANALKFGCIFFGVSSIIIGLFSISEQDIGTALSAIAMLVACLYGWTIAKKRSNKET